MMLKTLLFLLSILLLTEYGSPTTSGDHKILLSIKEEWGNPMQLASWASANYCSWAGVSCKAGGDVVTALSFQRLNLTGSVPVSVCGLRSLKLLDLSGNKFTGAFPRATLYACRELQILDLSHNSFHGELPSDINGLSPLMSHLNLSANNFSGVVPTALAELRALQSLYLDKNSFTGKIPAEFLSLTELTDLDMSRNELSGVMPAWVLQHQKLQILYLYRNGLGGELPRNITAVNLVQIDLSSNKFNGSIPEGLGTLVKLTWITLYSNEFSGTIPTSIGLLPNLQWLQLWNNMLSGELPPELGKHSPLASLEVPNNNLSGLLPDQLCANGKLFHFAVFNNSFSGELPASIGSCLSLDSMMLNSNNFFGEFPVGIWSLPLMQTVMINKNNFTGALPSEIPLNINYIEMGDNYFSGSFPETAAGLVVFKAENNKLTGELPANMSRLGNLTDVSTSGNYISGSIPMSITSLKQLNSLNLSDNRISGTIPPMSIGLLPSLRILDLSGNELTGRIPLDFNNLNSGILNLSCNNLTGEVPSSLQIAAYESSFLANNGLCAKQGKKIHLLTCGHGNSVHDHKLSTILTVVGVVGIIVGIVWLLLELGRRRRIRTNNQVVTVNNQVVTNRIVWFTSLKFDESHIMNNLQEGNLIGKGGCGKVYRMQLTSLPSDKTMMLAVKKIECPGEIRTTEAELNKQFQSEATVLGGIKHRCIVKLLGYISGGDTKTKLLVYEYMEKGDLHHLLHRRGTGRPLDWPTRLAIATDVATGLCYMHTDQVRPIVHMDIKSSNVLIDSNLQAKIADFGLAQILANSGVSMSVPAIGGTFGYIAPECRWGKISEKFDIYSFGVLLLELTTGSRALDPSYGTLTARARKALEDGLPLDDQIDQQIPDPAVYLPDIISVFELGVICTREDPRARPDIKMVLFKLTLLFSSGGASKKILDGPAKEENQKI